jgi:hypothetical protein
LVGEKSEHARDAGTEDVSVDEPDPAADGVKAEGKIGGVRQLSHAALAATHREEVADARQLVLSADEWDDTSGVPWWPSCEVVVLMILFLGVHTSQRLNLPPR